MMAMDAVTREKSETEMFPSPKINAEAVLTYLSAVSIALYSLAMAYGLTHLSI